MIIFLKNRAVLTGSIEFQGFAAIRQLSHFFGHFSKKCDNQAVFYPKKGEKRLNWQFSPILGIFQISRFWAKSEPFLGPSQVSFWVVMWSIFGHFSFFPLLVVIGNRSDIAQKEPIYFVQYDEK